MPRTKNLVFFEFTRGHKTIGTVTFELYTDLAPKTVKYFTEILCLKAKGYLGSTLSRVVPDGYLIGGDLKDVAPTPMPNESFDRRHAHAGVLSVHGQSSQFCITLAQATHFDGKNVVIGQLVKGMDVLKEV